MNDEASQTTDHQQELAKLARPRLPAVFARERLFDRLDRHRSVPGVWICAPAGSGKTTLIASYLDATATPSLWYQVDEGDNDVASFFFYLGKAVKLLAPKLSPALLTPDYSADVPAFARRYFQDLYGHFPRTGVTIVVDNYQHITSQSTTRCAVREAIAQAPQGTRVLVLSREGPPGELARLRVNRQLASIEADDVRITRAEADGFAELFATAALSEAELTAVYEKSRGWAAGLTLLLRSAAPGSPENLSNELLFEYFASEVLNGEDGPTRRFMITTALLPKMTAAMARQLTDYSRAEEFLEQLCRKNLFTTRSVAGTPVYQYHALFREYLLNTGSALLGTAELVEKKALAAELLRMAGQTKACVALLRELERWSDYAAVVDAEGPALMRQGRHRELEAWLTGLPPGAGEQTPALLLWLGLSLLPTDPARARSHVRRAYEAFQAAGDAPRVFLSWSAICDSYWFEFGDFSELAFSGCDKIRVKSTHSCG